jgi:hypothetical protein
MQINDLKTNESDASGWLFEKGKRAEVVFAEREDYIGNSLTKPELTPIRVAHGVMVPTA